MSLIAARNISVNYGANTVLRDVSLSVDPGEIVTVVGPNGSGKTTLLRLLIGAASPATGHIDQKPGLRIGYGIAPAPIAGLLHKARQPFNANAMAQAAALAGLADTEHQEKTLELTRSGLKSLEEWCREKQLPTLPSAASFLLIKTGRAEEIFRRLLEKGVIVRSMTSYGLPDHIRVSIGTPGEMERFKTCITPLLNHG